MRAIYLWIKYSAVLLSFSYSGSAFAETIPLSVNHNLTSSPTLALQHAGAITPQLPISEYLVSEKLDGVRGHWNGKQMYTRSGRLINLPVWFTHGFPTQKLDGELWIARGEFDAISALVRTEKPDPELWRKVKFMVFDFPDIKRPFAQRYQQALEAFSSLSEFLVIIPQQQFLDQHQLDLHLEHVITVGGEGLMLHRKSAIYRVGRNDDLVKLKRYQDAEAVVVAHYPGKGKFTGMLGAIEVKTPEGIYFRIGSGFTNEQRANPPAIGSVITYKFYGLTKSGVPKFASFLRERSPL